MKIKLKIFAITIFLFIFSIYNVYAIDMFLNSSTDINSTETITENITQNDDLSEMYSDELSTPTNPTPTVTHTSSDSTSTLNISDIINVILISVCIVLIFLGIAILIRCK